MESNQTSLNKTNNEEKILREVNYDAFARYSRTSRKTSDRNQKSQILKPANQTVVVCIKPKVPVIKTLYIAEKNRFVPQKNSDKCGSRLAIGDCSSLATRRSDANSSIITTTAPNCTYSVNKQNRKQEHKKVITIKPATSFYLATENSTCASYSNDTSSAIITVEQCSTCTRSHQISMKFPKIETGTVFQTAPNKILSGTLDTEHFDTEHKSTVSSTVQELHKKVCSLEKKVLQQEMVLRSIDHKLSLSSSDENTIIHVNETNSSNAIPGCSYIEYSHVPETSGFQRRTHRPTPPSSSKATSIQKEHNSEQYGRDFTLYDNVTARGRRQCASVPCKRHDVPKQAAERVHKIRHKLNPVRDYRLMDTVHYLAQGEFAPRDDGIKLTPSREAVLSDIIWEDVCRTHWPNTRLARRVMQAERCNTRSDLQRLIDSLLRERIAHIERRRRRHYRIVKLNHRHENCRPLGKTGDIIVASNENKGNSDENASRSEHNILLTHRTRNSLSPRISNKSKERIIKTCHKHHSRDNDCTPGPSYAVPTGNKEPTCCYHTTNPSKIKDTSSTSNEMKEEYPRKVVSSSGSNTTSKIRYKNPRLVIKKNSLQRKNRSNEPNLEHFILLPTLVVRTPSNMRRQKKFNELYHRILNVQLRNRNINGSEIEDKNLSNSNNKDIGVNINLTLTDSETMLNK